MSTDATACRQAHALRGPQRSHMIAAKRGHQTTPTRSVRRKRPAWTLIECVAVLAVLAMLTTIVTTVLVRLLVLQSAVDNEEQLIRASLDFSRAFHEDWRWSTAAERLSGAPDAKPDAAGLRLILPDNTLVDYTREKSMILRSVRSDGQIIRREAFRVPPHVDVTFIVEMTTDRETGTVVLVPTKLLNSDQVGRELRVTAIRHSPHLAKAR